MRTDNERFASCSRKKMMADRVKDFSNVLEAERIIHQHMNVDREDASVRDYGLPDFIPIVSNNCRGTLRRRVLINSMQASSGKRFVATGVITRSQRTYTVTNARPLS